MSCISWCSEYHYICGVPIYASEVLKTSKVTSNGSGSNQNNPFFFSRASRKGNKENYLFNVRKSRKRRCVLTGAFHNFPLRARERTSIDFCHPNFRFSPMMKRNFLLFACHHLFSCTIITIDPRRSPWPSRAVCLTEKINNEICKSFTKNPWIIHSSCDVITRVYS